MKHEVLWSLFVMFDARHFSWPPFGPPVRWVRFRAVVVFPVRLRARSEILGEISGPAQVPGQIPGQISDPVRFRVRFPAFFLGI